ncbi:unnamed protein product [Heterobilharzia americana]|nr:unnamed protein product [Heterobilharzia americana]
MLRYSCMSNGSNRKYLFPFHKFYFSTLSSSSSSLKTDEMNSLDIDPPLKRYRNSTSIIRALISCVQHSPDAPNYRLGPEFTLLSATRTCNHWLAKAKGRLAARVAARDFFPNDIVTLSKEIPRIDRWIPIQTPEDVIKRAVDGSLSNDEAMDRLILLLAPNHAWQLYNEIATEHKWSSETLHGLLDLLCATNGGRSGFFNYYSSGKYNWSYLPDPDEIYFLKKSVLCKDGKKTIQSLNEVNSIHEDNLDGITKNSVSKLGRWLWTMQTTAELLFHKEHNILNTSQAYRSMIRGAAKFENADRALELTKLAWSSKHGDKCLDLETYNLLIRSLHYLTTVKTGEENVWDVILNIIEHVKTCGEPINISIFTSILYALTQTTIILKSSSSSWLQSQNYIPIGLGLLNELKRLNFKPELGTLANLFQLIYETPIPVNQSLTVSNGSKWNNRKDKRTPYSAYKCSQLLNKYLDEIEVYFNDKAISGTESGGSPKRFDAWTTDDYVFFVVAMKCALNESNIELGKKIHCLLTQHEDRTFLLPNFKIRRYYEHAYCKLMLYSHFKSSYDQQIEIYHNTYRQCFNNILISKVLTELLVKGYKKLLNIPSDNGNSILLDKKYSQLPNPMQSINTIKVNAYNHLCRLLSDMLNIEIAFYLQRSIDPIIYLTNMLCDYSTVSPKDALQLSMKIIDTLQKSDRHFMKSEMNNTTNTVQYDGIEEERSTLIVKNYQQLVEFMINNGTKLCFPIRNELSIKYNSNDQTIREDYIIWKTRLTDTLYKWFNYSETHNMITWKWAVMGLSVLWKQDEYIQVNFLWNVIEHLMKQNATIECCTVEERNSLKEILDTLENSISRRLHQDIGSAERMKWIMFMRTTISKMNANTRLST